MHSKASFKRLKRPLGSRVIGFARVGSKRAAAIGIGLLLVASGALAQQAAPVPPVIIALDGAPTNPSGSVHDFTGLPLTADGWTDLHGMIMSQGYSDARIVYVSTSGNDSTAQVYNQSSAPLGAQPLNPSGQIAPFRTLNAAYERLRNGYPDVMLLRRGDSWGSTSLFVNKAGRNNAERMIVGAYGPESVAQPIARVHSGLTARDVVLSSARVIFSTQGSLTYDGTNVLVEDYRWEAPSGVTSEVTVPLLHGTSGGAQGGSAIRRSSASWTVFFAGWSNSIASPSRFEENTISRSGLGTGYSNVYFSEDAGGIQSVRNQSLLTGNAGFRQRSGGVVRENLTAGTQPGLGFGGGFDVHSLINPLEFRGNVGLHIYGPHDIVRPKSGVVQQNIFTAFVEGSGMLGVRIDGDAESDSSGLTGLTSFSQNVFSVRSNQSALGWSNSIESLRPGASIHFEDNDFLNNEGGRLLSVPNDSRITFGGNRYFSSAAAGNWFSGISYEQMIPSTGQAVTLAAYPDPGRDILTYMRSLGANPSSVAQALDWYSDGVPGDASLAGALANRRGAWDERFTAIAVINHVRQGFGRAPF